MGFLDQAGKTMRHNLSLLSGKKLFDKLSKNSAHRAPSKIDLGIFKENMEIQKRKSDLKTTAVLITLCIIATLGLAITILFYFIAQ